MATDKSLWYGHKSVEREVFQNLNGNKHVTPLRCETKLPKLVHRIQEYDAQNPNSDKSLAIPFLYERGANGDRNHFYTIFREKDNNGQVKYIVQDSNGDPAPQPIIDALQKATPGAQVESWDVKQQTNDHDCGPHTVENLKEMAAAKAKNPNQPLTPNVISTNRDMGAIRKKHGVKPYLDESPDLNPSLDEPGQNKSAAEAAGGAGGQPWGKSAEALAKKYLNPTYTPGVLTIMGDLLGLFSKLMDDPEKKPLKTKRADLVEDTKPAPAPVKGVGGSGRSIETSVKETAKGAVSQTQGMTPVEEVSGSGTSLKPDGSKAAAIAAQSQQQGTRVR